MNMAEWQRNIAAREWRRDRNHSLTQGLKRQYLLGIAPSNRALNPWIDRIEKGFKARKAKIYMAQGMGSWA